MNSAESLGIVGVGLMGGSVGLAARRTGQFARILGYDRRTDSLHRALAKRCIDEACIDLSQLAHRCSIIVVGTPVDRIAESIVRLSQMSRPGTLFTDTGSTKAQIVREIEADLPSEALFVGSHPLCGSEKHGPDAARADLFEGRWILLTPTDRTPPIALTRAIAFWQSLGGRTKVLSPEEHDRILALTSHLPHLLASSLAGMLPRDWHEYVATGFRDTTRLAAGDPEVWSAIFRANAPHVLAVLQQFQARLDEFREAVETQDATTLVRLLAQAKGSRDDLGS